MPVMGSFDYPMSHTGYMTPLKAQTSKSSLATVD